MTDNSNAERTPVAEMPQTRNPNELYQTRTILERQLSLAQHKDQQAVAILERALALVEHISCGEKSTRLLPTAADHIRSALALLDNQVTRRLKKSIEKQNNLPGSLELNHRQFNAIPETCLVPANASLTQRKFSMKRDAKAMDAYLHDLLDCMPDAMLVVNSSGTITLVVTNCIYPQLKPQLSGFSEPH